jgi:hypothetical protein
MTPRPGHDISHEEYLALIEAGILEPGFFDEHGDPAPLPEDIDEWRPVTHEPETLEPGEQPF